MILFYILLFLFLYPSSFQLLPVKSVKNRRIRDCQSLKPKKGHARTEGKFKSFVNLPIEIESVKSKLQRGCVVLHANHFLVHFP